MMKIICVALTVLSTTLFAGAPARAADWYAPQEPFAVYGNTYYVGTGGISALLITSSAGHVLIDVGGPMSTSQVVADLWERKTKQPTLGNAAFIDKNACRSYAAKARAWLAQTLANDAAAARAAK